MTIYEENAILTKVEKLVDQLPYKAVNITIEMKDKTFTLQKEKPVVIGFYTEQKKENC